MSVRQAKRIRDGKEERIWIVDVCYKYPDGTERRVKRVPRVQTRKAAEKLEKEILWTLMGGVKRARLNPTEPVLPRKKVELPKGLPSRGTSVVYCIRSGHLVKIGTSTDVESRLRDLEAMSPHSIEILALYLGGHHEETEAHRKFAKHRHHGEWFHPAAEILEWAAAIGIRR